MVHNKKAWLMQTELKSWIIALIVLVIVLIAVIGPRGISEAYAAIEKKVSWNIKQPKPIETPTQSPKIVIDCSSLGYLDCSKNMENNCIHYYKYGQYDGCGFCPTNFACGEAISSTICNNNPCGKSCKWVQQKFYVSPCAKSFLGIKPFHFPINGMCVEDC